MQNYTNLLLIIFSLTYPFTLTAQKKMIPFEIDASFHNGYIIQHQENVGHLVGSHPVGFNVSVYRHTTGEKGWEKASFYPKFGLSFNYLDFKSDILGKSYALILNMKFSWWLRKKSHLEFKIGTGPAIITNPWDLQKNPKNTMISSYLNSSMQFALVFSRQLTPDFKIRLGLELTHFSNAAFTLPNAGMNMMTYSIGTIYSPNAKKVVRTDSLSLFQKSMFLQANWRSSFIQRIPNQQFENYVGAADLTFNWRLARKDILMIGFEYSHNTTLEDVIAQDWDGTGTKPDFRRVGLLVGHELVAGKVSLITQVGYYIYRPYDKIDLPLYQRIGMRYYIGRNFFQFGIKTHGGAAECLEFGIGRNFLKL